MGRRFVFTQSRICSKKQIFHLGGWRFGTETWRGVYFLLFHFSVTSVENRTEYLFRRHRWLLFYFWWGVFNEQTARFCWVGVWVQVLLPTRSELTLKTWTGALFRFSDFKIDLKVGELVWSAGSDPDLRSRGVEPVTSSLCAHSSSRCASLSLI